MALAIGITPQLLPAIVSVSLSAGSRELARRRVLVKRLVVIEVLFTDKTATLTEGAITFDAALDSTGQPSTRLLLLGLVCNEATMTEEVPVGGHALDAALWSAPAAQALVHAADGPSAYRRLGLDAFDHKPPTRLGGRSHG